MKTYRQVSGSALGFKCVGWQVRPSARSLSGICLVARFSSLPRAARFAARWSAVLPARCKGCVARFAGGGVWAVSVPVLAVVSRG